MNTFHAAFADELLKTAAAAARSMLTPESSNVRGFRYDAKAKQLFVTYKSGGTYRYDDVPASAAKALGRNRSVGKSVNRLIRAPGYAYEKVGWVDELPGGLADQKNPTTFDPGELGRGRAEERKEHTTSKHIATEIAMDHLTEDPKYYEKLKAIEKKGMSELGIAGIVRRALEGGREAQVAKFIRRTGARAGERMAMGKNVAVRESRSFMAGHPSIAGARTGNVLPAVSGEFNARFGTGEGKTASLHQLASALLDKVANGDMLQYFQDHPKKLREKLERDRRKNGLPKQASALIEVFGHRRRRIEKLAGVAKRQVTWNGLAMKIEQDPGDIRSGKSKSGHEWSKKMFASYGYVPGTGGKGDDGEAIDVYFAKDPVDAPAYKVQQLKHGGEPDEQKYMIGYPSKEAAKAEYLRHMPEWAFGGITSVGDTFEDFKSFIKGL